MLGPATRVALRATLGVSEASIHGAGFAEDDRSRAMPSDPGGVTVTFVVQAADLRPGDPRRGCRGLGKRETRAASTKSREPDIQHADERQK